MANPPLDKGFGYGIVLGLGFAFAFGMILTTWILKRYQNEVQTSEMFSTAGRTVRSGLVASAVVSSWTCFAFTTYATSNILGSPGKVYDLLVEAAKKHPVDGNAEGSYLTMRSREGAIFFVINIVGNFGTVFCDNGYYNKAIAAHPVSALPGYVMGGLSWFAIPWLCATTMGLAALATETNPAFPTYPKRMDPADVNAGLVLPNAAVALLGKASSAELIAVSSIFTYDIYQTYFNPQASGRRLIYMAHCCVVGFAVIMAGFSVGLYYIGISLGYLYLLMGVIVSSAVLPASLTLLWKRQNMIAATLSPVLGLITSLIAWLVTAKKQFGSLSVDSTGANNPMLAGNVAALLSPCVYIPILTYAFGPDNYDYASMRDIRRADDDKTAAADPEVVLEAEAATAVEDEARYITAGKIARYTTVGMTLILLVLWPMPLYGSGYIFSKSFFTGWVSVGIAWLFFSGLCVAVYPLWEGRHSMAYTFKSILLDLAGKKKPALQGREGVVIEGEGSDSGIPTEKVEVKS
ncbi:hypothetical protein GP486_003590 [Trichoglossum hirsutum]|uniref:Urea active transporter n=1 Tax=Trichoglossum hirsutum TaxID=265104 RepID=A0A9P8LCR9_9PEZI|nr:hypothetical protein GP486_003590 [Trichoglossum hirsutum]